MPIDVFIDHDKAKMVAALEQAIRWFEEYADYHEAKADILLLRGKLSESDDTMEKANRNRERAVFLRQALKGASSEQ